MAMAMANGNVVKNWSSKVEDYLDDDDHEGAIRFLEEVVANLENSSGVAATDLSLAAALHDLVALLDAQGLSEKADSLRSWELVIRQRVQDADGNNSWEEKADRGLSNGDPVQNMSRDEAGSCRFETDSEHIKISTFEDWEVLLHDLPSRACSLSIASNTPQHSASRKDIVKRGRGAFTFGASGLYSDRLSDSAGMKVGLDLEKKDAEFGTINFCEPLGAAHSPRFKVQEFDDAVSTYNLFSKKDLEPNVRRPATSAQAAQRMIAGALSKQETGKRLHAKVKGSTKESQEREEQRKQRLQSRQRMREEAWGSD